MTTVVYLVSSGMYEDYGIDAIFSSREKAQRYMETHTAIDFLYGYNEIEERIVDEFADVDTSH